MDELFGEAGLSQADIQRKEAIEREIGLTAILNGEEGPSAGVLKVDEAVESQDSL